MDKVISYNEFLKHKDNLETYLNDLFDKIPELNVYFPISLNSEERHLIYKKSKGYLFEKLHKIGSKYSIKLWKPGKDGMNNITEEEEKSEEEKSEDEKSEDDFKEHLTEFSNVLEKQHEMMFSELKKCRSSVNRVECIFTCIVVFNFIGSVLLLTRVLDLMIPLPQLNIISDF